MVEASVLVPYRNGPEDYADTEELKGKLKRLRAERKPFYLSASELDEILRWKLRGQYGRGEALRVGNTDEVVRAVTTGALSISHDDLDYLLDLRVNILCAIRGMGVPVASAVLALVFPEDYCVVDFRGWRQVFGEDKRTFSLRDYKRYLNEIRKLQAELPGWSVQEIDGAIWEKDRVEYPG